MIPEHRVRTGLAASLAIYRPAHSWQQKDVMLIGRHVVSLSAMNSWRGEGVTHPCGYVNDPSGFVVACRSGRNAFKPWGHNVKWSIQKVAPSFCFFFTGYSSALGLIFLLYPQEDIVLNPILTCFCQIVTKKKIFFVSLTDATLNQGFVGERFFSDAGRPGHHFLPFALASKEGFNALHSTNDVIELSPLERIFNYRNTFSP